VVDEQQAHGYLICVGGVGESVHVIGFVVGIYPSFDAKLCDMDESRSRCNHEQVVTIHIRCVHVRTQLYQFEHQVSVPRLTRCVKEGSSSHCIPVRGDLDGFVAVPRQV